MDNWNPKLNTEVTPDDLYKIQQALGVIYDSNNVFVFNRPKEIEVFALIKDEHGQYILVDPKTGQKLSNGYDDMSITPHGGLFKVTKKFNEGHTGEGYIDYNGKVVLAPEIESHVERYHNGSEIVFNGNKAVNIKTGQVLHETHGGERINVFGNLLEVSVENRKGKNISYDIDIFKSNGEDLGLGKIEDIRPIITETQELSYVKDGNPEMVGICTRIAFKTGDKYGLINALDGNILLKPVYKNINRFYGGVKFSELKRKYNTRESLTIPIEYVLVEDEQGKYSLLDQDLKRVLSDDFSTIEDLKKKFDEQFPDSLRTKIIF